MRVTRWLLVGLAVFFGLALNAYAYLHEAFSSGSQKVALADDNQCVDAAGTAKTNPNKMLFVSCGGFLE